MNFSLIICTYHRPKALMSLLDSVKLQTLYPDEILIVDGSKDQKTKETLEDINFPNLSYFKVKDQDRGLTKQRNFGISKVGCAIEVVCFLDDDVVLEQDYFELLLNTYQKHPAAIGVGGYIKDVVEWIPKDELYSVQFNEYKIDGNRRD